MRKNIKFLILMIGAFVSHSTNAAIYEITISAEITGNQSDINGSCGVGTGFSACPYFPLDDIVTMSMIYDDSTPVDLNFPNSSYYANAITSLNFSYSLYTGNYSNSSGFGQFSVSDISNGANRDRLGFNLWDNEANTVNTGSANPMHLPPIQTSVANSNDDVYGDIEIESIRINLVALNDLLFNSKALPTSLSISDFDQTKSNWGVTLHSLGTTSQTVGWGGSAGGGITGLSVREVSVPEPSIITLMGLGLAGLGFFARRKRVYSPK